MSFQNLGLKPELLRAVALQGYKIPTPIQLQAIPAILARQDVLGGAQTGTGKTAAYTLPILQLLSEKPPADKRPRALVLTPTRELAAQVEQSIKTYGSQLSLKSMSVFGGVPIEPQTKQLRTGVDILVATPGRLLDHARQRNVDLSGIEILILDEADRMLDMGFINDIKKILALLPKKRQNLLFSATYTTDIKRLADSLLHSPRQIEAPQQKSVAELVMQIVHPVEKSHKRDVLSHLISTNNWRQVLVFTNTKHGANRLVHQLSSDGIHAVPIHGNKSQAARTKALAGFKDGAIRVLVATEVAARGLDINQLPHVVNYELPHVPEDYIHRIGRTGRAGSEGCAVSLVCEEESPQLGAIERLLQKKITREVITGYNRRANPQPAPRTGNPHSSKRKENAESAPTDHYRKDFKSPHHRDASGFTSFRHGRRTKVLPKFS
jgi:ATP-dependent RNA helicase RhlE